MTMPSLKKLDKLIVKSFIGPFIVTFFITLFIFIMQFLWVYIDDLVGKGLEWYIILQLIFYSSASMVPLALPLAILLASIMCFGNLGETYELTAIKSSGISLIRVFYSHIVIVIFLGIAAFIFSNYLMPTAYLKAGSLLYDIRQQRPAFNIKEGVFYSGIEGYSMKVDKKGEDGKTIRDVMIYDHTSGKGNDNVLTAKSGKMQLTNDKRFLLLEIYDGNRYQEMDPKDPKHNRYEHITTHFKTWQKNFDLTEFALSRTNESFFKDHYKMLNVSQLSRAMDTIKIERASKRQAFSKYITPFYLYKEIKSFSVKDENEKAYFFDKLSKKDQNMVIKKAKGTVRSLKSFTFVHENDQNVMQNYMIKHQVEYHLKFTLSIACVILFFIGAPLGAIIRKGGLGMPIVIAVFFFIIFHILSMTGKKLTVEEVLAPFPGVWISTIVLFPLGIFLTYKAMNDSVLFNADWYVKIFRINFFKKLFSGKDYKG